VLSHFLEVVLQEASLILGQREPRGEQMFIGTRQGENFVADMHFITSFDKTDGSLFPGFVLKKSESHPVSFVD
jgi:hypothetical protein